MITIPGRRQTAPDRQNVLVAVVYCDGDILIAKRSNEVGAYRGLWNVAAGYIEEGKTAEEVARHELSEEFGIEDDAIDDIRTGEPYDQYDEENHTIWVAIPLLVRLRYKPEIRLDWEHTDSKWIHPQELTMENYPHVENLDSTVMKALNLLPEQA